MFSDPTEGDLGLTQRSGASAGRQPLKNNLLQKSPNRFALPSKSTIVVRSDNPAPRESYDAKKYARIAQGRSPTNFKGDPSNGLYDRSPKYEVPAVRDSSAEKMVN